VCALQNELQAAQSVIATNRIVNELVPLMHPTPPGEVLLEPLSIRAIGSSLLQVFDECPVHRAFLHIPIRGDVPASESDVQRLRRRAGRRKSVRTDGGARRGRST
jgi:hypothetical protein